MTDLELRQHYQEQRRHALEHVDARLGDLQQAWGVPCLSRCMTGQIITACRRCGHILTLHPGDANPAETSCIGCRS